MYTFAKIILVCIAYVVCLRYPKRMVSVHTLLCGGSIEVVNVNIPQCISDTQYEYKREKLNAC